MMLNKCILIGRLARDPELRYTDKGTAVCNFTLAVERSYTNREGETLVDFIKIVTWRKLAKSSAQHLQKGRLVAVTGSIQINKRKEKNYTEMVANQVKFLDSPTNKSEGKADNQQEDDELLEENFDVPF